MPNRTDREQRVKQAESQLKELKRCRFNMDLNPDLACRLTALAEQQRCSASGLVNLAICLMLDSVDQGALDFKPYLNRSKSNRYDRTIKLPARKSK
jgi:hypothetical protein